MNATIRTLQQMNPDSSADRFLDAWKRGVKLAGQYLFTCARGYDPAPSVDAATSKWQLIPNMQAVEGYARMPVSDGERMFLLEMVSFYNDDDAAELKRKLRLRRSTVGTLAIRLDQDRRNVLADLLANYGGW
ncbi:hypothetical protein [Thioalbus denitrificans]|uniref:Uncharacterized protein n=1 Tax=Thioalbus denitrificans TaxID=547122 RepID=A0A369CEJ6_9GAMM|nr:hypothetical protein [Thioalbus denitrificans]RCX32103.1 hypothetical protein DFQ59_102456 [Thioalbus denitrificans]